MYSCGDLLATHMIVMYETTNVIDIYIQNKPTCNSWQGGVAAVDNLTEVIDGSLALLENPKISIDDLMQIISGPDFPTGGTIDGKMGIYEAYKTGRGIIYVRAKTSSEEDKQGNKSLIINEIPYMVNKARMLERIAELVKEKKIDGIKEIRDESDKDGLRVVIDLKRGESLEILENNLFAQTQL